MNSLAALIGYVILGLSILFTITYCFNIRSRAKKAQATEATLELQGFLMFISVVSVFVWNLSPFHLLWMMPASFVLGLLSASTPLKILWFLSSLYFAIWYVGINDKGRRFYLNGGYEKAKLSFEETAKRKPTDQAFFNLALTYAKLGQHDKEISNYYRAIELNPKRPELYFNLGIVLSEEDKTQQAIPILEKATALRPNYLKAHYSLCKLYFGNGDFEKAKQQFLFVKNADAMAAKDLEKLFASG